MEWSGKLWFSPEEHNRIAAKCIFTKIVHKVNLVLVVAIQKMAEQINV